jgi:hypothetical protein
MRSERSKATVRRYSVFLGYLFLVMARAAPTMVQAPLRLCESRRSRYSAEPLPVLAYDIGLDGSLTFQARQTIPFQPAAPSAWPSTGNRGTSS